MGSMQADKGRKISIFGTDAAGKPFFHSATVLTIAGSEMTVGGLDFILGRDDVVGIRYAGQKGRFHVSWVGADGTPQQGQAGLRPLEIESMVWASLTGRPEQTPVPTQNPFSTGRDRRRYPRIRCQGSVRFQREDAESPDLGRLQLLSEGGCYVQTLSTAPASSQLDLVVNTQGLELRAQGVVRDAHVGFGMGIAFAEMNAASRAQLRAWASQHCKQ